MARTRLSRLSRTTVALFAVAVCLPAALLASPGFAADSTKVVVQPPKGAVKPVAGTGMGTQAALDNPRCNTDAVYGVYGRWNTAVIGGGPACVVPPAAGAKNGGASATGVTATSVKIVAIIPSPDRSTQQAGAAPPVYVGDSSKSTWENAIHDYLFAYHDFYEQWGRSIDVTYYTSSGIDETAQRADAVAIAAMKPFAVLNFDSYGLETLVATLAKDKIIVNGYVSSLSKAQAAAPYRWGAAVDTDAAAASSAEVLGKQLVGKKAEFGGDDVKSQTRKLGLVTIEDFIDLPRFKNTLAQYKGKIVSEASYPGSGGALGDPTVAQQNAPTIVSKMKADGVTTVVLFTDRSMNVALMEQATQQNWFPEWFYTGSGYSDLPVLAQATPDEQAQHGFGISNFGPYYKVPANVGVSGAFTWYWGAGAGTTTGVVPGPLNWLLQGIHYAGPDLTVKNFQQGLFSAPPTGGNPKNPLVALTGYGRTTGLPYDAYTPGPADFMAFFMDPYTTAISPGTGTSVKHASFYPNGAVRHHSGDWPKSTDWFDKSTSITEFTEYPPGAPPLTPAPPCAANQCPSTGATSPTPGVTGTSYSVTPTPAATSGA